MFRVPNCRFQCPNVFALSLHQWNTVGFAEATTTACCSKRLEIENKKLAIKMTKSSTLIHTFIALTLN